MLKVLEKFFEYTRNLNFKELIGYLENWEIAICKANGILFRTCKKTRPTWGSNQRPFVYEFNALPQLKIIWNFLSSSNSKEIQFTLYTFLINSTFHLLTKLKKNVFEIKLLKSNFSDSVIFKGPDFLNNLHW